MENAYLRLNNNHSLLWIEWCSFVKLVPGYFHLTWLCFRVVLARVSYTAKVEFVLYHGIKTLFCSIHVPFFPYTTIFKVYTHSQ